MKKCVAVLFALLLAASTFGAAIFQDNTELALNGTVDFFTNDGTLVALNAFFGYFVIDYLELGPRVSFWGDGDRTAWALGLKGEYNFDTGTEFIPFVGLALDYANVSDESSGQIVFTEDGQVTEGEIEEAALVSEFLVGCKYFIKEDVAISAAFAFDWATGEIYVDGDDAQSVDARVELGLRLFF
jgi:hypothetical protein